MAILIVSVALAFLIVLLIYVSFSPNVTSETFVMSRESELDPSLQKAINFLGGDIAALIPNKMKKKRRQSQKMRKLFIQSGNPWNINQTEFFVLQILLAIGAFFVASLGAVVLSQTLSVGLLTILVIAFTIIGFQYPVINYTSTANDRVRAFKRELPEAIDFLVIALSGGNYSLPSAMEKIIRFLPENSVMREEFKKIMSSLHSGKSLQVSLDEFAKRAPTEGIEAFVNSLNNANQLSAPISDILSNRAEASRKELNAEIDKKIAVLSTKIMAVFGPMAYLSILIVILSPTASSLMQLL